MPFIPLRIRDLDSLASSPSSGGVAPSSQDTTEQPPATDPDDDALVEDMKNFSLVDTKTDRFFGPSSNMHFMWKMMMAKGEARWSQNGWELHPVCYLHACHVHPLIRSMFSGNWTQSHIPLFLFLPPISWTTSSICTFNLCPRIFLFYMKQRLDET